MLRPFVSGEIGEKSMGETMAEPTKSMWSKLILGGSIVGAALLPIGALGSRFGLWEFILGFAFLLVGSIIAAIGVVVGIAALIAANKRGLTGDKPAIYSGMAISVLILAVMGLQISAGVGVPPIHNISTDVNDPPQFDVVVALRGEQANSLEYPADENASLQQQAYPWVKTLETERDPADSFAHAVGVLQNMGLELVNEAPLQGLIEATATTFWFGFKDDVVVRIRPNGAGSVIDVRSVSRVGLSDLGANARRIGEFLDGFAGT